MASTTLDGQITAQTMSSRLALAIGRLGLGSLPLDAPEMWRAGLLDRNGRSLLKII